MTATEPKLEFVHLVPSGDGEPGKVRVRFVPDSFTSTVEHYDRATRRMETCTVENCERCLAGNRPVVRYFAKVTVRGQTKRMLLVPRLYDTVRALREEMGDRRFYRTQFEILRAGTGIETEYGIRARRTLIG